MLDSEIENSSEKIEFVSIVSGGQGYCIEITSVREIRRWNTVTPLPNSDPSVLGVMNLRGAVIPIVDLSTHLGFEKIDLGPRSVVVVVGIGSRAAGLVVDAVSEILSTPKASIKPNPNMSKRDKSNNITGLFSIGDEMLKVLSIDSLFEFDREELV